MKLPPPLLLIPTVSTSYCLAVLLAPGDTTALPAYRDVNRLLGGELGLTVATTLVLLACLIACLSARPWVRTAALYVVVVAWTTFALGILSARPQALLPGATLAVVLSAGYALHEHVPRRQGPS